MDAIIVAYDPLPGDAICALPAICGLAEKYTRVFLEMQNHAVLEIGDFPPNVATEPWANDARDPAYHFLGVAAAINYRFEVGMPHPIQNLMRFAGLPMPEVVPQPRIKRYFRTVESFDVILAPFTSAPERTLDVEQVEQLVKLLIPHRVAILGGGTNPNVSLTVPHFYDYPFDYAAQLLRQAKVVVAVDSFPGRLAHAAGVKHHIVLDTGATPITTQVYPGAIPMPAYGIEAVAAKVRSLLSAPLS